MFTSKILWNIIPLEAFSSLRNIVVGFPRKACLIWKVSKINHDSMRPLGPLHAGKGEQKVPLKQKEASHFMKASWCHRQESLGKCSAGPTPYIFLPESFVRLPWPPNPFLTSDNFSKALSGDNFGFSKDLVI